MSARGVRIVVGEGPSTRKGLLRFVLDGEGYDVVAEAATTAELARLMATHRPDVVVLDDGIGATAVGMINEMSPNTRVVLVWPGAVVPIGGAARVEPSRVLQDLGPTVERLTGQPSATGSGQGAALLESASTDPDMLRAMLLGGAVASGEPIIEDREPAPVVILPLTPTIDHDELILNVPDAEHDDDRPGVAAGVTAAGVGAAMLSASAPAAASEGHSATGNVIPLTAGAPAVGAQSALNRRLGNMALAGAAVASAIVLALALGGTRISIEGIRGQADGFFTSPPAVSSPTPGTGENPGGGPDQGGQGQDPDGDRGATVTGELSRDGGTGTTAGSPSSGTTAPPQVGVDPGEPPTGGDDVGGNGDGNGGGSGSDTGGGGDDHSGDDAGDHDSGGGNDRDGGDHDNGGGNDGDSDDRDNGGGNDDADNPGNSGGNGGGEGEGGGSGDHGNGATDAGAAADDGGVVPQGDATGDPGASGAPDAPGGESGAAAGSGDAGS